MLQVEGECFHGRIAPREVGLVEKTSEHAGTALRPAVVPHVSVPAVGAPSTTELLGARIRQVRLARGATLVRLAELAGLSHSFLSQLERGLTSPSMTSLERIAVALGTSPVELLSATEVRHQLVESRVLRSDEGPVGPYGMGVARLLGPELLSFVPMEFTGTNTAVGDLYRHDEDEFLLVVEGRLALDLGGATQVLAPRDAATIAAFTPHRWRSADGDRYRLVVVKEGAGVAMLRTLQGLEHEVTL